MTPRLALADEDAIVAAVEARADRQRQADVDAGAATRLAELRAGHRCGRYQLPSGQAVQWVSDGGRRLECYLVGSMGGQRLVATVAPDARGWRASCRGGERRAGVASVEEAMVWVEQQIG